MSEHLLTVDQAAKRLQLSRHSVRLHLREGKLRGVKRGHEWRVPESALFESTEGSSNMTSTIEYSNTLTSNTTNKATNGTTSNALSSALLLRDQLATTIQAGTHTNNAPLDAASELNTLREERFNDAR